MSDGHEFHFVSIVVALAEFAALDPVEGEGDGKVCHYCCAPLTGDIVYHDENCLWVKARRLLEMDNYDGQDAEADPGT